MVEEREDERAGRLNTFRFIFWKTGSEISGRDKKCEKDKGLDFCPATQSLLI